MAERRAIIVVDLGFGDAGKGSIVDFLVRHHNAHSVVRFNGGPQAGHNVVTPDGRWHTFSQFGSGAFVHGVKTILSRFMLIEPFALFNELAHLQSIGLSDALDRLIIDEHCPVITPAHQAANRLRELHRDANAHGTCGMGCGELMAHQLAAPDEILIAGDLSNEGIVRRRLRNTRDRFASEFASTNHPRGTEFLKVLHSSDWIDSAVEVYALLAKRVSSRDTTRDIHTEGTIIFEGAQGTLLDEDYGFHPYTTWSRTTFANADLLLNDFGGERMRLGVLRSYCVRHGPGPFVTEDESLRMKDEPHNTEAGWQGRFRRGHFDAVAARYAIEVCGGIDALALTHLDRVGPSTKVCLNYDSMEIVPHIAPDRFNEREALTRQLMHARPEYVEFDGRDLVGSIERALSAPVLIESHGASWESKRVRER